jgi:hypothetical protein
MNRFYLDTPPDGPEDRRWLANESYERDIDDLDVETTLADWDRDYPSLGSDE